ncbi:synaptic vesicle glycoprotein 2C isoform X2 [Drosophila busckii]|uniref:synaptic vesicle glycoprotein 2C isoform X2 n=1 Tax=Drosophila busckii TaxID=30019 RepID=UPI00083F0465|nr:synaptic vesicle glycoprotein 2C isoform X2 [Drosophila busckii]
MWCCRSWPAGFGRMQFIIFFGCAIQQWYVSNEQFGSGIAGVAAGCDLNIDDERSSWMIASIFTSQILSSNVWGFLSDEIGRRKQMLIAAAMTMILSSISALMPNFWLFLANRFLVGCFVTGLAQAVLTYVSEFTQISLRPRIIIFVCYFIGLSMIYVPAIAMLLLPQPAVRISRYISMSSWRLLLWMNLFPGLIAFVLIYSMPESPKYYLSVDKHDEAYAVLNWCCRLNKGKDVTLQSLGIDRIALPRLRRSTMPIRITSRYCSKLERLWLSAKPLVQGHNRRYMGLCVTLCFTLYSTGFGLTVWAPRIVRITQRVEENKAILCDLMHIYSKLNITEVELCRLDFFILRSYMIYGCICLGTFMLISLLLMRFHRKTILILFSSVSVIAGLLLNVARGYYVLLICYVLLCVPPLCTLHMVLSVIIDVIPTRLRSKAVAFSMMIGRVGTLMATLYVGYTFTNNCFITFNAYVIIMIVSLILILLLPKDTDDIGTD